MYRALVISFIVFAVILAAVPALAGPPRLFAINPFGNEFVEIDQATAAVINTTMMTINIGGTIAGGNGLATDPTSGIMYAILKIAGEQGRHLATIDPFSAACTSIGGTGMNFSALTFDSSGQLWGVTGDGAIPPETLFTIEKTDGSSSLVLTLGNGDDGESIEYNPDDGLIYHMSGVSPGQSIFESIDPNTLVVTDIGTSELFTEAFSMVYAGGGNFLVSDFDRDLWNLTTSGQLTLIGNMVRNYRGMAFTLGATPVEETSWGGIKTSF